MSIIARAKSVKGSKLAAEYKEQKDKKAVVIAQENMTGFTPEERWDEMKMVAKMNKRTGKAFIENVISPIKEVGYQMTAEEWHQLAIDYADKLGYRNNQWYAVLHQNTDERHLHLIVNRIDFTGKNTINDHRIGERAGKVADQLAQGRGLKTAKELTKIKTDKIAEIIREESRTATSWEEFQERMKAKGYLFQLNYNAKGLNGARVIPLDQIKPNKSRREILSKKGYTLSKIDRKIKINDLDAIFNAKKRTFEEQEKKVFEEIKQIAQVKMTGFLISEVDEVIRKNMKVVDPDANPWHTAEKYGGSQWQENVHKFAEEAQQRAIKEARFSEYMKKHKANFEFYKEKIRPQLLAEEEARKQEKEKRAQEKLKNQMMQENRKKGFRR